MKNSNFKFLGYKVPEVKCKIKDAFGNETETLKPNINVEQQYDPEHAKFVDVILKINITTKSKNFTFYLELKGRFELDDDFSEDKLQTLAEVNAPAILYPFARSLIATYTAQANVGSILLPTMNFQKK